MPIDVASIIGRRSNPRIEAALHVFVVKMDEINALVGGCSVVYRDLVNMQWEAVGSIIDAYHSGNPDRYRDREHDQPSRSLHREGCDYATRRYQR